MPSTLAAALDSTIMPGITARKALKSDLEDLQAGNLGLSESEKNKAVQRAVQGAAGVAGGMQQQIAQQQLASGSQFTGQAQRAQQDIAKQTGAAAAQAAAATDQLSAQLQEARKQAILGRLDQERQIMRERRQGLLGGIGAAVGGAVGGPAGAQIGAMGGKGIGAALGLVGQKAMDVGTAMPRDVQLPTTSTPSPALSQYDAATMKAAGEELKRRQALEAAQNAAVLRQLESDADLDLAAQPMAL